ncbi:uncharacterized protein YALI1_D03216g [Yarrowia lipolytica]|uniref:Uncharacterized protein n=1 Tax=Yarrowia lipolytica TaxID=4952 RepID=A0A1D8NCX9_YARLL|nr:hypothetical protein YALI1_D03216g [Yarrowia lipolytica]
MDHTYQPCTSWYSDAPLRRGQGSRGVGCGVARQGRLSRNEGGCQMEGINLDGLRVKNREVQPSLKC